MLPQLLGDVANCSLMMECGEKSQLIPASLPSHAMVPHLHWLTTLSVGPATSARDSAMCNEYHQWSSESKAVLLLYRLVQRENSLFATNVFASRPTGMPTQVDNIRSTP